MSKQFEKILVTIKECFMIALCTLPYGLVVNFILVPHAIVGGGLTGYCEILYFATNGYVPIWLSSALVNLLLLITAFFLVGKRYVIRTIFGVFCTTMWFKIVPILETPLIPDPFMAVVLSGIFVGTALGVVFLNNGSTGGTDIVAMLVNKYHHLPMGRVLLFCDILAISLAYFLPELGSNPQEKVLKMLYGLTYTFISSNAVDFTMNRMRRSVQFFIFSKKYQQIADALMQELHRGVTFIDAEGAYSKESFKMITTIARQHDSNAIFRIVHNIDPHAFVSQSQIRAVVGQGFDQE